MQIAIPSRRSRKRNSISSCLSALSQRQGNFIASWRFEHGQGFDENYSYKEVFPTNKRINNTSSKGDCNASILNCSKRLGPSRRTLMAGAWLQLITRSNLSVLAAAISIGYFSQPESRTYECYKFL